MLEIERGRYTRPITARENRICIECQNMVEDEYHFMMTCKLYVNERQVLFSKINDIFPNFIHMNDIDKFSFLFINENPKILSWVGKFIHTCMSIRNVYHKQ